VSEPAVVFALVIADTSDAVSPVAPEHAAVNVTAPA
jgi:hypothetical protein